MKISIVNLLLLLTAVVVDGNQIADPGITFNQTGYAFGSAWLLQDIIQDPNEPTVDYLGGLRFFTAADGSSYLCVVEDAEEGGSVYCMDIERDATTGYVKSFATTTAPALDITNEAGQVGKVEDQLDIGFSPGPGGFDYISFFDDIKIGQATWSFDAASGKPNGLNIANSMDVSSISYDGIFGLEFSNIAKDPNDASRALLFGVSTI